MTYKTINEYFSVVKLLAVVFLVFVLSSSSLAHVGLTYPPARNYDLDFMDNIRTKPPCGMPKGSIGTTLVAGSLVNITWHLSYPHRGGYRLELLDKEEKLILDLKTGRNTDEYIQGDATAQWHTLTVPENMICDACTIRLVRQASEWSNSYRFWSCADVRIVSKDNYKEDCLGHGTYLDKSGCNCDEGYWGPRCQYKDECETDANCGTGNCIDLGGTSLPRKQCFCPYGFHGEKCEKSNKNKLPTRGTLNLGSYNKEKLSDKMSMYYKMIPAAEDTEREIEFVLVVNGTSYGALGWRPASLNKTCKMWPYVDDDKKRLRKVRHSSKGKMYIPNPTLLRPLSPLERSMAEPEPSMRQKLPVKEPEPEKRAPHSEPKAEVEPEAEPESSAESHPEPEKSVAEPEAEKRVPHSEPKPEGEPESEPESPAESHPEPEKSVAEPEAEKRVPHSEPEKVVPESEPKSEPDVAAESEPKINNNSWLKAAPESNSEPEPEVAKPEGSAEPESESKPEVSAEPESESKPDVNPEPESESKSNVSAEPESESKPEGSAEPESESKPEVSAEPESESKAEISAEPETKSEVSAEPESKPEVSAEPESESKPEASAEPESESKPEARAEPESESKPEASAEPESESKPEASAEPESESKPEASAKPESESKPEASAEPESESKPEVCAEPVANHDSSAEPEPESSNLKLSSVHTKERKVSQYSPKGDFHAMDCVDLVMGAARGELSRIRDYYTRDRSTPKIDSFWGGTDDLTSTTGWETGGVTYLIFRRKLASLENTDHSISGQMHVIWARGQQHGKYVHSPKSGLEVESPSVPNFYSEDEIKYHGHRGQRGVTYVNFDA